MLQPTGSWRVEHDLATEQQKNRLLGTKKHKPMQDFKQEAVFSSSSCSFFSVLSCLPFSFPPRICLFFLPSFYFCWLVVKSHPTLLWPQDCSPPGSSVHGISPTRILKWLPFPIPGDLPDLGVEPTSPAWAVDSLPLSHREAPSSLLYFSFSYPPSTERYRLD